MAPELIFEYPTEKSDIYSFGVILWELITCRFPYPDAVNDIQIFDCIKNNKFKFEFPEDTPLKLKQLAEQCLSQDKDKRPTATKILSELELLSEPIEDKIIINTTKSHKVSKSTDLDRGLNKKKFLELTEYFQKDSKLAIRN